MSVPPRFPRHAHAKIVATVGPACREEDQLADLIRAGVDVFRINFAHGTLDEHAQVIERIRRAGDALARPVAILADLAGPKIRLGELAGGQLELLPDAECRFVRGSQAAGPDELTTSYERLIDELHAGDNVMLADGTVGLVVTEVGRDFARCRVVQPGLVRSRQGVNLPNVKLSAPAVTPEDEQHARWAADQTIDYLGVSFVRRAEEVRRLKDLLRQCGSRAGVIAKIEKPEALADLEAIVRQSDGVMVARGDLGVEIDVARVPIEQKRIIATAARYGRPVITATQMLDSMQQSRRPTRAEAADVANAVLDGTDACMLSGETAIGQFPRIAVETMNRIILATEDSWAAQPCRPRLLAAEPHGSEDADSADADSADAAEQPPAADGVHPITAAVAEGATHIAQSLGARLVVVLSHTGVTALALSRHRCKVAVVGVSDCAITQRQMSLYWGVIPLPATVDGRDELVRLMDDWGQREGYLAPGDRIVLVIGNHLVPGAHNLVEVHVVPP